MALTFAATSTDRVDSGTASSINNISIGTLLAWVYPTDLVTNNRRMIDKSGTQKLLWVLNDGIRNYRFGYNRSTSNLNIISQTDYYTQNAWQFLGATWDTSLTNTDQHLYRGTESAVVTECSSYATQQVGSGTHDDSS